MNHIQFGDYIITKKINSGGMSEIYEAIWQKDNLKKNEIVALKCISPETLNDKRFVEMFINEAELGKQLNHHNIVKILSFDKIASTYCIAMELIEGLSLAEMIAFMKKREQMFPPRIVVEIFQQILDGLDYAHNAETIDNRKMNIIHRDIKPSNILISKDGIVKIADFGLAKASVNVFQTASNKITKGSLAYMSPEQITHEETLSPKSDLFSAGIVLYEMLMLKLLFDGANIPTIMQKITRVAPDQITEELPQSYKLFSSILQKALSRNSSNRYNTANDMKTPFNVLMENVAQKASMLPSFMQWIIQEYEAIPKTKDLSIRRDSILFRQLLNAKQEQSVEKNYIENISNIHVSDDRIGKTDLSTKNFSKPLSKITKKSTQTSLLAPIHSLYNDKLLQEEANLISEEYIPPPEVSAVFLDINKTIKNKEFLKEKDNNTDNLASEEDNFFPPADVSAVFLELSDNLDKS